jgi:hypothetical protein
VTGLPLPQAPAHGPHDPEPLLHDPEPLLHDPEPLPHDPEPLPHDPEPLPHDPEPLPHDPEPLLHDPGSCPMTVWVVGRRKCAGAAALGLPPARVYDSPGRESASGTIPHGAEHSVARQVHCGGWFAFPLGGALEQINAYIFYILGSRLQSVFYGARLPVKASLQDVQLSVSLLDLLIGGESKYKLDDSSNAARALRGQLVSIIEMYAGNSEAQLDEHKIDLLSFAIRSFDASFSLELGRAPIFAVAPRGVFDMRRLIANASSVFDGYLDRLPARAVEEVEVAGRCLAFSLWTAAGFHIARATEAVVKRQMEVFGCPPIKKSQRNLGNYIHALTAKGAHPRVIQHLTRFKELHRNPLMHPDVTLAAPEGLSLWATCVSLIQAMVADMEAKRDTPDPVIVAMLPPNDPDEDEG